MIEISFTAALFPCHLNPHHFTSYVERFCHIWKGVAKDVNVHQN